MKQSMPALAVMLVAAVAVAFAFGCGREQESQEPPTGSTQEAGLAQTTCPVMGGAINKDLFFDYEGKRIYVCCEGCLGKVEEDPEKYVKQLEDEGVVLDRTPGAADAM